MLVIYWVLAGSILAFALGVWTLIIYNVYFDYIAWYIAHWKYKKQKKKDWKDTINYIRSFKEK